MKKTIFKSFLLLMTVSAAYAENSVAVIEANGTVQVRYGVEEKWHPAIPGVRLKFIDTIMTGEGANAVLQLPDGRRFILGSNCLVDIADLRIILQNELFLYLTTQKVRRIESPDEKKPLRIGNVSVVHGGKRDADSTNSDSAGTNNWIPEFNGAQALYLQNYFPNAVIKLHKILQKYTLGDKSVPIYYFIGKSLEALNLSGQAIDAYQFVVDHFEQNKPDSKEAEQRASEARQAIERLRKQG